MPVLSLRYFASLVSRVAISVSMSLRTFAIAVCSFFEDGTIIRTCEIGPKFIFCGIAVVNECSSISFLKMSDFDC